MSADSRTALVRRSVVIKLIRTLCRRTSCQTLCSARSMPLHRKPARPEPCAVRELCTPVGRRGQRSLQFSFGFAPSQQGQSLRVVAPTTSLQHECAAAARAHSPRSLLLPPSRPSLFHQPVTRSQVVVTPRRSKGRRVHVKLRDPAAGRESSRRRSNNSGRLEPSGDQHVTLVGFLVDQAKVQLDPNRDGQPRLALVPHLGPAEHPPRR